MIIEIPDEYLDPMKEMPVISNSGRYKWAEDSDVLAWMGKTDKLCVAVVLVRRALMRRAKKLGIITHDSEAGTWR